MLGDFRDAGLFSYAEQSYLRLEAMDLFERCLTEGKPDCLEAFIEQQLVQEPPRVQLLQDIAGDLHQRLLSLREYHFDVRDRVLRALRDDFDVDIAPVVPANALESYHLIQLEYAVQTIREQNLNLTDQDVGLLHNMLAASVEMAAQLHGDITMTEHLHSYMVDWVSGLQVMAARRSWAANSENFPIEGLH
jgi:hypothetical protein